MSQNDWPQRLFVSTDKAVAVSLNGGALSATLAIDGPGVGATVDLSREQVRDLAAIFAVARHELDKLHTDRQRLQQTAQHFVAAAGGLDAARAVLETINALAPGALVVDTLGAVSA